MSSRRITTDGLPGCLREAGRDAIVSNIIAHIASVLLAELEPYRVVPTTANVTLSWELRATSEGMHAVVRAELNPTEHSVQNYAIDDDLIQQYVVAAHKDKH